MRIHGCWLSVVGLLAATAHAGVVVHMARKGSAADPPKDHEIYYAQDGNFRIDNLDEQGHVREMTLFRDGAIWRVDVQKRTFQKFDKNAMAAQQSGMQAKLQAAMQSMPPERRAMFEAKMKEIQQKTNDYALTEAGRSDHVGSYSCQIWNLARDGKQISEYCVASKGSLPGGDELIAATHKAATLTADALSGSPQMAKAIPPIYTLYGKMEGFPVLVRHMSGGKAENEDVMTSIERQALPAEKFEIPKGFSEASPGEAGAGG